MNEDDVDALEPMLISGMRRRPSGDVRHDPADGGALGTSTKGFLNELDRWLAARDELVRAETGAELLGWVEYVQGKRATPPQTPNGPTNGPTDNVGDGWWYYE